MKFEINGGFNKGDMITILSSFLYALHIAVIGRLVKELDPIILTFLQTSVAGIIGLVISLAMEPFPSEFSLIGILSTLYITIFGKIIAYGLQIVWQIYIRNENIYNTMS